MSDENEKTSKILEIVSAALEAEEEIGLVRSRAVLNESDLLSLLEGEFCFPEIMRSRGRRNQLSRSARIKIVFYTQLISGAEEQKAALDKADMIEDILENRDKVEDLSILSEGYDQIQIEQWLKTVITISVEDF